MTAHDESYAAMEDFLGGRSFNESARFSYEFKTPLKDRVEFLSELARGKRVLHIGCCDHVSVIAEKIASDRWLHGRLSQVASHCIGVDIDRDGVERARGLSKLDNIVCGDVSSEPKIPEIADSPFDVAIFADVIEHIGNPVHFLSSFLALYGQNIGLVAITVPNTLWFRNVSNGLKSEELINSDHRFCFTPYAVSKVAWDAGLAPVSLQMVNYTTPTLLKRVVLNRFPMLGGGIAYIGAPRSRH